MEARATIIIPNWNGMAHLEECLSTIRSQSMQDFRLLIIDNSSEDGSPEWVEQHHPWAEVLRLGSNTGFAGAVNAGIKASDTPFVALLNNDTALDSHWLEALVDALTELSDYDFAASRMVFYSDPDVLNSAGDVYDVAHLVGRNRGFGQVAANYATPERVFGACAGAALYRSSFFRDVGLFDERFFLMHEDTDINVRALIAGKRCVYVPDAIVRHKVRATIDTQARPEMDSLEIRNRALVAAKDLPWSAALVGLLRSGVLWQPVRSTFPLRPSNWRKIPGLVRSFGARHEPAVTGLKMGLAIRGDVWSRRVIGRREIARWLREGAGPL
ncbi:MAG: glycosyltransferase family 2 protein [Actinomycetota bacterium]|nr:glycosyltransferase family 2 protein [Actinomycetota bacterium]